MVVHFQLDFSAKKYILTKLLPRNNAFRAPRSFYGLPILLLALHTAVRCSLLLATSTPTICPFVRHCHPARGQNSKRKNPALL